MIDVKLINDVRFATSFRGYDKDEVDQFLEELAAMVEQENAKAEQNENALSQLTARCEELERADEGARAERERMLDEARRVLESARAKERSTLSPDGAAAGAATQAKFEAGKSVAAAKQEAMRIISEAHERTRAHTEAANAAIKNALSAAKTRIEAAESAARERVEASQRDALERAQASDRQAFERAQASDRRAEERASAIIQEAQGNADHMTSEASAKAERLVAEAEEKARTLLRNAEASIAAKREEFERLRDTTREFSGEYNRLLAEQLREMTLLAEKVNEVDFGDIPDAIGDKLEDSLSVDDTLEALKLDDIDSLLSSGIEIPELDVDAFDVPVHSTEPKQAEATDVPQFAESDAGNAISEDDDTYDFTGESADGAQTSIDFAGVSAISDEELDRIFSFDVEEIMNEDADKGSDD